MSFSTGLSYMDIAEINGVDADLNPMMMPLFNTANSGRSQIDFGLGGNFLFTSGALQNLRIAAEVKLPVSQDVNGVQMNNGLMATMGVQYAIGHNHE